MNKIQLLWHLSTFEGEKAHHMRQIEYNPITQSVNIHDAPPIEILSTAELQDLIDAGSWIVNGTLKNGRIMPIPLNDIDATISHVTNGINWYLGRRYNEPILIGHDKEASALIVAVLELYNIKANPVHGWVRFDYPDTNGVKHVVNHSWVEVDGEQFYYIDISAEQFNPGMYPSYRFSPVRIAHLLAHGLSYDKPEEIVVPEKQKNDSQEPFVPIRMYAYELYKHLWESDNLNWRKSRFLTEWFFEELRRQNSNPTEESHSFEEHLREVEWSGTPYPEYKTFMETIYPDERIMKDVFSRTDVLDDFLMDKYHADLQRMRKE